MATRTWRELTCIGFIPVSREGHAAALVDDVIYIFGGRGMDGKDLGDLAALKLSSIYCYYLALCIILMHFTTRPTMVYFPEHGTVS